MKYPRKVPSWAKQAETFPAGRVTGAAAGPLIDCHALSSEAWGLSLYGGGEQSGLLAFAYLWRRFGPPIHGSDPDKELCDYCLGTPMPDVFLSVYPTGSRIGVGYLIPAATEQKMMDAYFKKPRAKRPDTENWRSMRGKAGAINAALFAAMQELLRPVHVRDVAVNILGRSKGYASAAKPSEFAGLGVPVEAMRKLLEKP